MRKSGLKKHLPQLRYLTACSCDSSIPRTKSGTRSF